MEAKLFLTTTPHYTQRHSLRQFRRLSQYSHCLGLGYLQSSVDDIIHVESLDASQWGMTVDETINEAVRRLKGSSRPYLGISSSSYDLERSSEIAKAVCHAVPSLTAIVGGWGPSINPDSYLATKAFDYVVIGEGEEALRGIIQDRKGKGVLYRKFGIKRGDTQINYIKDLDSLAFPWRPKHLQYDMYYGRFKPVINVISSRGCKGVCVFCTHSYVQPTYRQRSSGNVVSEIVEAAEMNGMEGEFVLNFDDLTFLTDASRIAEIIESLKSKDYKPLIKGAARVRDIINARDLLREYRYSIIKIETGIESLSDSTLARWKKGQSLDSILEAIGILDECGIIYNAFMIGMDEKSSLEELKTFASLGKESRIPRSFWSSLTNMPLNKVEYDKEPSLGELRYSRERIAVAELAEAYGFRRLKSIIRMPELMANRADLVKSPEWQDVLDHCRSLMLHAYELCLSPISSKMDAADIDGLVNQITSKMPSMYQKIDEKATLLLSKAIVRLVKEQTDPIRKASLYRDYFILSHYSAFQPESHALNMVNARVLRRALRLDPGDLDTRMSLSEVYLKMKDTPHFSRIAPLLDEIPEERFVDLFRHNMFPFFIHSLAHSDSDKAIRLMGLAYDRSPIGNMAPVYALELAEAGDFSQSLEILQTHLDFCPVSPTGWYYAVKIGRLAGDEGLIETAGMRLNDLKISKEKLKDADGS